MRRRAGLVACGVLAACAIVAGVVLLARGDGNEEHHAAAPAPAPRRPPPVLRAVHDFGARVPPGRRLTLRSSPRGPVLTSVGARTEFGSPQTFSVAYVKGPWLAVRSTALGNKRLGWVRAKRVRLLDRKLKLDVDLSERRLTWTIPRGAAKGGQRVGVAREMSVAIGAPETPTPLGDFYVTDKLRGADFGSYYGCCILALSGRQPNLPEGWSGGDRLAIHGSETDDRKQAVTNGCLHLQDADLRFLMRTVPLGTAVHIHA